MIRKPLNTIIVKTTGSQCNLSCSYCFYLRKELQYSNQGVMDEKILEIFISQLMEQSASTFGIVWQGGEPSLAGAGFFKKAISLMQEYGKGKNKTISNLLQTNGYSLTDEIIEVLSAYSFLTGLSLDGTEDIHDFYRKTANGKGSWKQVMRSWEKLTARNIATNILCCVTSVSASQAEKIYLFYKQHQMLWLQFIPVCETDDKGEITDFSVPPEDWGLFMCKIFDLWYDDFMANRQAPNIRFIENAFQAHLGMNASECTFAKNCGSYLVLEHNGDVFSCDYRVDSNTRLGNINENRLTDMLNSPQQLGFGNEKSNTAADCNTCHWKRFCYGGCPRYRNKITHAYYYCNSWKKFLIHSESRLIELAGNFRQNNPHFSGGTLDLSGYF
jgi:uncharacterized protein